MPIHLFIARIAVAGLVFAAVVATLFDTAGRTPVNPFNFFGYFTIQSNIALAVVLVLSVIAGSRGRGSSEALQLARASVTTYIAVVGLVYALLLAPLGAAGGVPVPWANTVMHIVTPLYGVADWLLSPDRRTVPWNRFWVVLLYPLVWIAVVLLRGATDGWVPYPFLDPAQGYGTVGLYCAGIAVTIGALGALVWASSRLPVLGARKAATA